MINDLNRGHYDIKVTTGPSFSTRRSETAEQLGTLFGQNPQMAQLGADIYFKSLDLVGADELVERVRKAGIKQGVIEPNEEEQQKISQAQQQEQQMKAQAMQMELAMKQAEVANEQAMAKERESKTMLNTVKAQVEQLELAQAQQDLEAQRIAAMRLRQTVGMPIQ
jgi:K+/H+ antiporter YhaU regulatory subunit KhtT